MLSLKKTIRAANAEDDFFLPELCLPEALLSLILLAELLVLVLVLAEPMQNSFDWVRLAMTSLFVQWIVLLSAGVLCLLRPYLKHLRAGAVGCISCALVVGLTLMCTALADTYALADLTSREAHLDLYMRHGLIGLIMSALLLRYFYLQSQWQRQKQAQLQARIESLQAHIRPHFSFNSLNSIVSLVAVAPDKAEQAILDLSDLFRASLATPGALVRWRDELELAKRYLAIEQYRLGERLQVNWQVDQVPEDVPIPQLTLQPLLENAVLYGIAPRIEGGCIEVQASYRDQCLELCIINPCEDEAAVPSQGTQQALTNINARLTALFGTEAGLTVERRSGSYVARLRYSCTRLMQETRVL